MVKLHQNITKLWKALKCEPWLFTTTLKSLREYKLLSLLLLHSYQMFSRSLLSIYFISTQMYCKSCLASRKGENEEKETIIENEEMYCTGTFAQSIFYSVWFEGVFQRSVGIPSLCEVCDAAPRTVDGGRKSRFHHKAAGSCGMWRG